MLSLGLVQTGSQLAAGSWQRPSTSADTSQCLLPPYIGAAVASYLPTTLHHLFIRINYWQRSQKFTAFFPIVSCPQVPRCPLSRQRPAPVFLPCKAESWHQSLQF